MKTQTINRLMVVIMTCGLGFLASPASAGQDSVQIWLVQQAIKAKQQAHAAEAAKATKLAECRKLLAQDKDAKLAECPALLEQDKGASK